MARMADEPERQFMGGQKSKMWTYLIFPEAEAFTFRNPPACRANISNESAETFFSIATMSDSKEK
jgi:hypothetical protein